MVTVAALYVDPRGVYPTLPGVDVYGLQRNGFGELVDATRYQGPWPVVAHPPCGPWAHLKHLHGRPEERPLALRAVEQVRAYGGVLEHPAGSGLWKAAGLPPPGCYDAHRGYTVEVCQVEWGHVARKRTWLYCVGVPYTALEPPPFPGRKPTHWVSGSRTAPRGPVPPGIKVCSAQQRNRTPLPFAEYLVRLARSTKER
jgi:hypothetical protein